MGLGCSRRARVADSASISERLKDDVEASISQRLKAEHWQPRLRLWQRRQRLLLLPLLLLLPSCTYAHSK